MRKLFVILFALLMFQYAEAQVPGYLGKRLSLDFGGAFSFNTNGYFISYGENRIRSDRDILTPVFRYEFSSEYSVSKKGSIAFGVMFAKYKASVAGFKYGNETIDFSFYDVESLLIGNNRKYSLTYRFYRKGGVSPVGKYFGFGLGLNSGGYKSGRVVKYTGHLEDWYANNEVLLGATAKSLDVSDLKRNRMMTLVGEVGTRTLISNSIYLSTSLRGSLPLRLRYLNLFGNANDDYFDTYTDIQVYDINGQKLATIEGEFYEPKRSSNLNVDHADRTFVDYYLSKYQVVNEMMELKIAIGFMF